MSRLYNRTHELALRLSQLWRSLPFLFKFQGVGVVAALLVAVGVANVSVHQGYRQVSFALPAAEQARLPWHAEVDAFGEKVAQALGVRRSTANEFAGWILEASERQGLEPELLASLVLTESSFRKEARSHVGAIGPTQLRPEFWSSFCGSNLQDPAENIYCGAQVLSHLKDRCGNEGCALEAYNVGIYAQRPRAASRYVAKIVRYREQLRNHTL